jgi:hypothetical protein
LAVTNWILLALRALLLAAEDHYAAPGNTRREMRAMERNGVHVVILRPHLRANQEAAVHILLIRNRALCLERTGVGAVEVRLQRNRAVDRFLSHRPPLVED